MKTKIGKQNVINLSIAFEKKDPLYRKCTWADISLDLDKWDLYAHTDVGDYHYSGWVPEQGRTFLDYMISTVRDSEYILSKVSNRSEFSLEQTKDLILSIYGDDMTKAQKYWLNSLGKYRPCFSGSEFEEEMKASGLFDDWRDKWELPQYDYPVCAKTFAEILSTVVRDELIKYRDSLKESLMIEDEADKERD